jgi:hypothetical protein
MERLAVITDSLDRFFDIQALDQDPAFSRLIPMVSYPVESTG